jgi:phosphoglucosamine mutase
MSLADLADVMDVYPQVLKNVSGVDRSALGNNEQVHAVVAEIEAELGGSGRVLLRPSGTEALVRVMVEAADEATAHRMADRIVDVVSRELAL